MVYAEWSPTTYYVVGDIVEYLASIYESLTTNYNRVPPTNPGDWNQIGGGGAVSAINAGVGIAVNPVPPANPTVSINLTSADARLTITNGIGTQRILNNQCPISVAGGTSLTTTGTNATGITIDMPNVGTAGTSAFPTSITTDAQGRVSAITAGTQPVASVASGGAGISITGTAVNPLVNNTGLLGLSATNAGANITITGTPTNPIISATGTPSALTSYAGFAFPNVSPSYPLPAIPSQTWTIPPPPGFINILQGNTGYPAINTNENLQIEMYVRQPFSSGVSPNTTWYIFLTYWNGSQWVQCDGANVAYYTNQTGTYIPIIVGIGGGNMANTGQGDSLLRGLAYSVGGQVRFNIGLAQSGPSNTSIDVITYNANISYTAVPITNLN
jgi:hypothetical protein